MHSPPVQRHILLWRREHWREWSIQSLTNFTKSFFPEHQYVIMASGFYHMVQWYAVKGVWNRSCIALMPCQHLLFKGWVLVHGRSDREYTGYTFFGFSPIKAGHVIHRGWIGSLFPQEKFIDKIWRPLLVLVIGGKGLDFRRELRKRELFYWGSYLPIRTGSKKIY